MLYRSLSGCPLVRNESAGDQGAISPARAIDLTQLIPETAKGLGEDPYDPEQNLLGGATYLKRQYQKYGD
ncbi:MAG: lytic transglycosylase domain-containing protein [Firmicutes bacterium]|nr:lytic transglycosylase domain-containing protein [Bacillota bacterium]